MLQRNQGGAHRAGDIRESIYPGGIGPANGRVRLLPLRTGCLLHHALSIYCAKVQLKLEISAASNPTTQRLSLLNSTPIGGWVLDGHGIFRRQQAAFTYTFDRE
jgi:hypothetical protein